ncbi:hypothetical protein V2G26_005566 [Clonostachys chloroleuca]
MIGTSRAELYFIRVSIVVFRYTPVLCAFALLLLYLSSINSPWKIFATVILTLSLAAEGLFYLLAWRPAQARLRLKAVYPPPLTSPERRALFEKCIENMQSPERYLQGWFLGADLQDIRRENLREFIMWAFFDREETDFSDWSVSEEQDMDYFIHLIEERLGKTIEPGRTPVKSLRLNIDGIHTTYRSLAWYIVIFFVDHFTHVALWFYGFQYFTAESNRDVFPPRPQRFLTAHQSEAPGLSYWYSPQKDVDDTNVPIIFFHGIGVGLLTYIRFLAGLKKSNRAGIIAIETLPISFRLTSSPLDRVEFLRQFNLVLDHHNWDTFAIATHSYGSVQAAHILHSPSMRSRVSAIAMIDPVTIMLHLPPVAYNFTRRLPTRANEWQLWYFASTDPGVAHCLGRHLFWRDNIIWKDDLVQRRGSDGSRIGNRRVAVILSGQDIIVDVPSVAKYLESRGQDVLDVNGDGKVLVKVFPELDHAQVFDYHAACNEAIDIVTSCCDA